MSPPKPEAPSLPKPVLGGMTPPPISDPTGSVQPTGVPTISPASSLGTPPAKPDGMMTIPPGGVVGAPAFQDVNPPKKHGKTAILLTIAILGFLVGGAMVMASLCVGPTIPGLSDRFGCSSAPSASTTTTTTTAATPVPVTAPTTMPAVQATVPATTGAVTPSPTPTVLVTP